MTAISTPVETRSAKSRQTVMVVVGVLALLLVLGWAISHISLGTSGPPKRQVVKITLPDLPPPPPPKVEEKKPEPKQENKPTQQMEQKPVEAPPQQAQALKMEGAAGNGPSAFSSGSVGKDYIGGPIGQGTGDGAAQRQRMMFYANAVKQQLKDALERHLQSDERQITVTFELWIGSDGRIAKYRVEPSGSEQAQRDVKTAFDQVVDDTQFAPPGDAPQPLKMRMTLLPPAS